MEAVHARATRRSQRNRRLSISCRRPRECSTVFTEGFGETPLGEGLVEPGGKPLIRRAAHKRGPTTSQASRKLPCKAPMLWNGPHSRRNAC